MVAGGGEGGGSIGGGGGIRFGTKQAISTKLRTKKKGVHFQELNHIDCKFIVYLLHELQYAGQEEQRSQPGSEQQGSSQGGV